MNVVCVVVGAEIVTTIAVAVVAFWIADCVQTVDAMTGGAHLVILIVIIRQDVMSILMIAVKYGK